MNSNFRFLTRGLQYRISVVCQLQPREAPDFFFRRRDACDPFGAQVLFVKAGTAPIRRQCARWSR